ncbi:MAG TPA: AMP-binding protein, partial [Methylomirabilota bacterium]
MQTVFEAFMATATATPEHSFLCAPSAPGRAYHPDGIELTYAAVRDEALRVLRAYEAAGYGHGHRVALLFENRPEFFFHYLALNALGVSVVPVNPDYRHDELAYQMDHSDADLAVTISERVGALEAVAAERARPLPVVDAGVWPTALPKPRPAPRHDAPGLATETGLLYTSGTTGRPKGCMLSNFYYLNAGAWYRDLGGRLAIEPGRERFLNPLPLFHMNCQAVTATCAILTANCLILPERFSPRRWWPDVVATRATIIHYLGVMPPLLLNQAPAPEEKAHRVKAGLGAGVEPELHEAFEERFGFPLVEVWGMTETGRIFSDCHEPRAVRTRAFGRPHGGFWARVVDEQDREVPRETEGELVVRWGGPEGPRHGFFSGYLKNETATEEAWR